MLEYIFLIFLVAFSLIALVVIFVWQSRTRQTGSNSAYATTLEVQTEFVAESRNFSATSNVVQEDEDAWEGWFFNAPEPKLLNAHLEIKYIDGKGQRTTRTIRVREFDDNLDGGMIMAHCYLRNSTRTFLFSRIKSCVDLGTGELIEDVRSFFNEKYKESPAYTMDLLLTDYSDLLNILHFVAKADGQFRKEEKEKVISYIGRLLRDDRVSIELLDRALRDQRSSSLHSFKVSVGKVLRSGEIDPDKLLQCCRDIVETQKTVHPSEKAALDYIENRIKSISI